MRQLLRTEGGGLVRGVVFGVDPDGDAFLILGDGEAGGGFKAEAQAHKEAVGVSAVEADAAGLLDELGDFGAGPGGFGQASGPVSADEGEDESAAGFGFEARRASGGGLGAQSCGALIAGGRLPSADAAPVNVELAGYLDGRLALAQQSQGSHSPAFEFFRAAFGSHGVLVEVPAVSRQERG